MLDFYADWCVSCKEMERFTFTDPAVQTTLAGALLLKADVTANNAEDRELLQALPACSVRPGRSSSMPRGARSRGARVIGFQNSAQLPRDPADGRALKRRGDDRAVLNSQAQSRGGAVW